MKHAGLRLTVIVMLIASALGLAGEAEGKSYFAYISDSPDASVVYWVAKEAGIFKKHGLDIELIFINGSTRGVQSLIAGDLAFTGAVGTSAMNGRLAGGDIAIISSLVNTLPYYIIGKADIPSPERLKGRSAAVHIPGTSADFALRLALQRVGLSIRDIKSVTVGGAPARLAAVQSGQLDFTVVTETGKVAGEKVGLKVIIDMARLNVPFQFSCTVATGAMIRGNPDQVRRVVRALAESTHYYKSHKKEVIKIMQKYTRGQRQDVLEAAHSFYTKVLVEDTYPTLEGLRNTLEIQASWDPKAAKARVEDFVELRFVDELKKSGFIDQLYGRR